MSEAVNEVDFNVEALNVYGARVHNLKNIDISIPRNKLVVITGISGSGKSSLAFDTIYAEGQRRYMESFSAYARQFIGDMERPDVDKITGLSPVFLLNKKPPVKIRVPRLEQLQRFMISCACYLRVHPKHSLFQAEKKCSVSAKNKLLNK